MAFVQTIESPRATAIFDGDEFCKFMGLSSVQLIQSDDGILGVAQASEQIGFAVRRIYFIKDVPAGSVRGAHAHKKLRQCFICLQGGVTLEITRAGQTRRVRLESEDVALRLEPGCWRNLTDMDPNTLLLVLASDEYDPDDYIRDFASFEEWERQQRAVVPYLDFNRYTSEVKLDAALLDSLSSGQFVGGRAVASFEKDFAAYCGTSFAVGMGNGLDALTAGLKALGVGPGDEVIVPAHTFIATPLAVDAVGATPVLVDVERDSGLMDVAAVATALTPRTRAVIPVHLYGHPVDVDALREVLAGTDVKILEDAAQAHGALLRGRRCGALGDAAAFSFYPTKNLGALGDGGCITTDDAHLAEKARMFGNYGARRKYFHEEVGCNSRLDAVQAAVLKKKLPHLESWNDRRRAHARRYIEGLEGLPSLSLPVVRHWAEPVWHVFPVRVGAHRDGLETYLDFVGIGTNIHYPLPVHRQPCYANRFSGIYPNADAWANETLSLPLDPMHSNAEIDRVIKAVRQYLEGLYDG